MIEFFDGIWREIRYGLRVLTRRRGFSAAAVLSLAVGIGASTGVFSAIESTVFFPLPYRQANRIVSAGPEYEFSVESWMEHGKAFEAISACTLENATLTGSGVPERLEVAEVTSSFFQVLGVRPMLGRTFLPSETRFGTARTLTPVVILTYNFWRDQFNADPNIIGRAIHLDDKLYTVVGIMSAGFEFPSPTAREPVALLPLNLAGTLSTGSKGVSFSGRLVSVLAKLKMGVSILGAQAELHLISRERVADFGSNAHLVSLRQYLIGNTGSTVLIFWGAVGLVLLISCVNLSNLMLGRALGRNKEMALRLALGSSRAGLARQLIIETLLLSSVGALAGLAISYALVILVRSIGPSDIPRLTQAHINLPVLGFAVLVTAIAGLLAAMAPVRFGSRVSPFETLKEGQRTSMNRGHRRLQSALAVAEIAIALILVTEASLLVRSFLRLTDLRVHFDPHNLLVSQISLPEEKYRSLLSLEQFEESLVSEVRRIPGARAVAVCERGPMMGTSSVGMMWIEGGPANRRSQMAFAGINTVADGYFRALGILVREGREFESTDTAASRPVIVVNEAFAKRFFPDGRAIGQKVDQITDLKGQATVIGVVADEEGTTSSPLIYLDYAQHPTRLLTLLVRTKGNPGAAVSMLRAQVVDLDSDLPLFGISTIEQLLGAQFSKPRFETTVFLGFALIAFLLAALGVYGVISYSVQQRTHEMGVRIALGAEGTDVFRMILAETFAIGLAGITIGVAGAFALTRYLRSLLYQIRPEDPLSFAIAAGLLFATAALAGFLPARRAARTEPLTALRYE